MVRSEEEELTSDASSDSDASELSEESEREDDDGSGSEQSGSKGKRKRKQASSKKRRTGSREKRSKRRRGVNAFLDVEAQVGDEEEEEDADDFLEADEAREAQRLAQKASDARRASSARQQQSHGQPQEEWSRRGGAAHLESAIDSLTRRYQDQSFEEGEEDDDEFDDGEALDYEESSEANLLPDMQDPKLWMVKVAKSGVEREEVIAILNKSFTFQKQGKDLGIYSVYASDDLKGYIYVEAESQYAIKEALQGLRNLRVSGDIRMLPLKEMPGIFNKTRGPKQALPQRGDFVRVKRGVYAGDLAQVISADEQGVFVTARLIPRLDIVAMLDKEKCLLAGYTFEEAGHIVRRLPVRHLLLGALAAPTLAELREFAQPMSDADRQEWIDGSRPLTQLLKQQRSVYCLGDRVAVVSGELVGLRGSIAEIPPAASEDGEDPQLLVQLDNPTFGSVYFKAGDLRKDFREGECVRALRGANAGHSGLVTHIDAARQIATVFSPSSCVEFKCALESLTHAPQTGSADAGLMSVRGFPLLELVELTNGSRGVLVYIDRSGSSVRLLLPSNQTVHASVAQLADRVCSDLHSCLDSQHQFIEKHSLVTLACAGCANPLCSCQGLGGGNSAAAAAALSGLKDITGRVLHVWRDTVFLKVQGRADNGGVVAVPGTALTVTGGGGAPFREPKPLGHVRGSAFSLRGGARGGGRGGLLRFGRRPDPLVGRQVKIQRGRHKGVIANIRAVDREELTVLLQTKSEEVKVPKTHVHMLESSDDYQRAVGFIGSGSSRMSISSGLELGPASQAGDFPSPVPSAISAADGFPAPSDLRPLSSSIYLLPRSGAQTPVHYERRASADSSALESLIEEDKMSLSDFSQSLGSQSMAITSVSGSSMPMSERSQAAEVPGWCVPGCVLRIRSGEHCTRQGVIVTVAQPQGKVMVRCGSDILALNVDSLSPVKPSSVGESVVVIDSASNNHRAKGTIEDLTDQDAIVNISGQKVAVKLSHLALSASP